jgi:prephenate dehydrogenase
MRILILGAGKMGSFFTDILSFQHETAVFDVNPHQLRFVYNTYRFTTLEEIKEFEPELVINAVTVKYTLDAFRKVLPVLPKDCIISDIASVKTGLKKFYEESGFRYVCQSQQSEQRECDYHQRRRSFGKDFLQRPLPDAAPEHLRIYVRRT